MAVFEKSDDDTSLEHGEALNEYAPIKSWEIYNGLSVTRKRANSRTDRTAASKKAKAKRRQARKRARRMRHGH